MEKNKLSIIIPCYNEERNIPLVIKKLKNVLNQRDIEVILVDNGSLDNSNKIIKGYSKIYPSIKMVVVKKNIGYGFGVFSGLRKAKGEFICWTHADLQTNPGDCVKAFELVQKQKNPKKTFVKGKRHGRPLGDRFFTFGMSIFEIIILKKYLYDINAQPNLFHKSFLNLMKNHPNDFSFELYVYFLAKKNNYNIIRFPVSFGKRLYGHSNWNFGFKSRIKFIKRTINFTFKLKKMLKNADN